jgi:hypothetical protein
VIRNKINGGVKDMEIILIGVIAGAVAAGVMPLQGIMPKLF